MIFVTGIGRSGTSTTARVIHQHGIACMGHRFPPSDELNPKGYWEDEGTKSLLQDLIHGNWDIFLAKAERHHRLSGCSGKIGFKHPILCEISRETWVRMNPEVVYLCTRPEELILASILRKRYFTKGDKDIRAVQSFYDMRARALETNLLGLPFVKEIDFSIYRTDEWILNQIRSSL
jgi:hypothetical protein